MRSKLWYSEDDGVFVASNETPNHLTEWKDVTASPSYQLSAVMEGIWTGSTPLPDELAKKGSEHGHQVGLFAWAAMVNNVGINSDVVKMYAIPNGEKRDAATGAKLKAQGTRKGIPDIFLPVPIVVAPHRQTALFAKFGNSRLTNNVLAGLYIEMKKPNEGRVSPEQTERIEQLRADGYAVIVCRNWRDAKDSICTYLDLKTALREMLDSGNYGVLGSEHHKTK